MAALSSVLNDPAPRVFGEIVAGDGLHVVVRGFTPAKGVNRVGVRSQVVHAIAEVIEELHVQLAPSPQAAARA